MKSLSLSRPLILMMIGVPGSGKSFFARQFADTFNAPLVSYDYVRSQVFPAPTHNRAEDETLKALSDQQIQELVKTQKTFLVDGGMNARSDRQTIEKIARNYGYGVLLIWVQTDEPTAKFRATKRNLKRQGDRYNSSLSDIQFNAHSKRLIPPSPQESFVVVSGKHTYATQAKIILKKLITPRETTAQHAPPHAPPTHETQPSPVPRRRNVIIN